MNRRVPGNQTTFGLRDLINGVRYAVSVTALVGSNEGEPATVYIQTGLSMHQSCFYSDDSQKSLTIVSVHISGS